MFFNGSNDENKKPKKQGGQAAPEAEKVNIESNNDTAGIFKRKKPAEMSRFEYGFRHYKDHMFRVAFSVVKNEADAEEIVQEVFVKIASEDNDCVERLTVDADLRNYLLKAAKNGALNEIRKASRKEISMDDAENCPMTEMPDVESMDVIEQLAIKVEYKELVEIIRNLDDPYKDALYYHFVLDLTVPETAEHLGRSVSTVKKQIVRGKRMLLAELRKRGDSYYAKK